MQAINARVLLSVLFLFASVTLNAQTGNMWTELPYGQKINCLVPLGDYVWFGTDNGLVRYNRHTGEKKYITNFNRLCHTISVTSGTARQVSALVTDTAGTLYVNYGGYILRQDGNDFEILFHVSGSTDLHYLSSHKLLATGSWNEKRVYDLHTGITTIVPTVGGIQITSRGADGSYWRFVSSIADTLTLTKYNFLDSAVAVVKVGGNNIGFHWYTTATAGYNNIAEDAAGKLWLMRKIANTGIAVLSCVDGTSVTNFPASDTIGIVSSPQWTYLFSKDNKPYVFLRRGNVQLPNTVNQIRDGRHLYRLVDGALHTIDSIQTGCPSFRISAAAFDAQNNLWLTSGTMDDATAQANVIRKTYLDTWNAFYLHNFFAPGYGPWTGTPSSPSCLGSDRYNNAYFIQQQSIVKVDTSLNVTILPLPLSSYQPNPWTITSLNATYLSRDGAVWFSLVTNTGRTMHRYKDGVITDYATPFPYLGQGERIVFANDTLIICVTGSWGSFTNRQLHMLVNDVWTMMPLDLSYTSPLQVLGFDHVNNRLWTSYSYQPQPYEYYLSVCDLDDHMFTSILQSSFQQQFGFIPGGFDTDASGNMIYYGLSNVGGSYHLRHYSWNGVDSVTFNEHSDSVLHNMYGLTGDITLFPSSNVLKRSTDNYASGINRIRYTNDGSWIVAATPSQGYVLYRFDGSTFHKYPLFKKRDYYQLPISNLLWMNGKFLMSRSYGFVLYDPNGIPNLYEEGYNYATGRVFYDFDLDSVFSPGDVWANGVYISSSTTMGSTSSQGWYDLELDTGSYTLTPIAPSYYVSTPSSYQVGFGSSLDSIATALDFALQPALPVNDLSVDITASRYRPGIGGWYFLTCRNKGTTVIPDAAVSLTFDSLLSYESTSGNLVSVVDNTMVLDLGTLTPLQTSYVSVRFNMSPSVPIGDTLYSTAVINPLPGDTTPVDNMASLMHVVTGSYDPNEKIVSPDGGLAGLVDTTERLTYTIFFQNCGTDTAFNIIIRDTLHQALEPASLEVLGSSHPVQTVYQHDGILAFFFNNILLPDSNENEPQSHGFVKYAINSRAGSSYGTTITNTAHIYFDFNEPITTNTVITVLGVPTYIPHLSSDEWQLSIYPNPAGDVIYVRTDGQRKILRVEMFDATGRFVKSVNVSQNPEAFQLSTSDVSPGFYILRAETSAGLRYGKVTVLR